MDNTALKKHPQPTAAPSQQSTRDHKRRNPSAEPHRFPKVGPEKPAVAPSTSNGRSAAAPEDHLLKTALVGESQLGRNRAAPGQLRRPRGFPRVRLGETAVAPSGQLAKNRCGPEDQVRGTAAVAGARAGRTAVGGWGQFAKTLASGAKSASSTTRRTSTSEPSASASRAAHSTASSRLRTSTTITPPISSLASANGPSVTVRLPSSTFTRAPSELRCPPSANSSTPAFESSSTTLPTPSATCGGGNFPASLSASALLMIM